jgi:glucans biosynthesis protein C
LLIIPPQIYLVRLAEGIEYSSFLDFYPDFFNGIYPEGNFSWGHLWFLPYLLVMSLVAIPIFLYLRKANNAVIGLFRKLLLTTPLSIYLFTIPLFLTDTLFEPYFPITHALVGDWYALTHYFVCFLAGYLFASVGQDFWTAVQRLRYWALATGVISFMILVWLWFNSDNLYWTALFASMNRWSWILAIFGFSATYLNKESDVIKYRTQAVYPFYILHQTIIILIGYHLMNSALPVLWKALIMIVGTFAACWFIYEFGIRRGSWLRPLFGVKKR